MINNRQFGYTSRVVGRVLRLTRARVVRNALRERGLSHGVGIHSFTAAEELEALFELARACPPDARVLEIGSYLGASTCYLAAGLRGDSATITCVDTWQNETMPDGVRDTFTQFEKNLRPVAQHIRTIRKRSDELTAAELDGPYDLIFIDGDHTYKHARADFTLASHLVKPEGVLAFHDTKYYEGVSRVFGEALASGRWQLAGTVMNLSWLVPARFPNVES